jgi:N-carbamoylputrescine amidase
MVGEISESTVDLEAVRQTNVDRGLDLAAEAAAQDAQIFCLGELFPAPYFALHESPLWLAMAEPVVGGRTIPRLARAAAEHGMVIVAPIYELDPKSGKRFSTAVVIGDEGEILGTYRKCHVPDGINETGSFCEAYYLSPSDGRLDNCAPHNISTSPYFPVFRTPWVDLGVALCYDRHFEGVVSALAAHGAQFVVCPSIVFGEHARRVWHLEFRVDACRHNVFIGGSNRRGAEPPWNVEFFGDSYVCGPAGVLPNVSTHPELVIVDVDPAELEQQHPAGWNLQRDRRSDIL